MKEACPLKSTGRRFSF